MSGKLQYFDLVSQVLERALRDGAQIADFYYIIECRQYEVEVRIVHNQDIRIKRLVKHHERPWGVELAAIKEVIQLFTESSFVSANIDTRSRGRVFSFSLCLTSGKIHFRNGVIFISSVKDPQQLVVEMKKLDKLFPI